jgi:hypothetical protein
MTTLANNAFFRGGDQPVIWGLDFVSASELSMLTGTAIASGTCAIASAKNGQVTISGAATTDNSGYQVQAVSDIFVPSRGTEASMKSDFQFGSNVMQVLMGFAVVDASLVASAPSDGVYIQKASGAAGAYSLVVRSGGATIYTEALTGIGTDLLMHEWGIAISFDEMDVTKFKCVIFRDRTQIYEKTITGFNSTPPSLVPSLCILSGSATGTQAANVDLIAVRHSRT